MPRLPRISSELYRPHSSNVRIWRSQFARDQMQARIRAPINLIERAGVEWPTKPPILPMPTATSPSQDRSS
jgi:hypothetical protein